MNEDLSRSTMSHHGRRDFHERNQIENQVYATVFPVLAKYESRGFNAHARTQNIAREVGDRCEEFVRHSTRGQIMENSIPKPEVQMDGNQFHAHAGEAYPEGISGFGDTEELAIQDFEQNWKAAQLMSGIPEGQSPTGEQVKGLIELATGPKEEKLTLETLCQIMFDPQNQPPQYTTEEAWKLFLEISGRAK